MFEALRKFRIISIKEKRKEVSRNMCSQNVSTLIWIYMYIYIWNILLAIRLVLCLFLVVLGVENNRGRRKRVTRARNRLPNRLSDSVYPERKLKNRSGTENFSESSNGSNTNETEQQRHMDAWFQAVTVYPELHQSQSKSKRPSEAQSHPPTQHQHQPPSKTQSQPPSQTQFQPPSQPQSPSQALSQPFQTKFRLPSPAELQPQSHAHSQPLNMLTPATVLLDIRSEQKHKNDMHQRTVKDHGDTSALLNCGIEELRQKVDGLESRLQNLEGENEQLRTQLRNGNATLHGTKKKKEKQDKVLISDDNFARSYDPHVYKAKQQDGTIKSKNCCYNKERVESIKKEETTYCFDEIVFNEESNPTENMLQESFSVEDIIDILKFFNNRPDTRFHQNTKSKHWDIKETLADSMKPSAPTKDDVRDYLYGDFLPQINQHLITLPTEPIPPRDFHKCVTPISGVQKNELSRILFCQRCGFVKHLVIEVLDTDTHGSDSQSYQMERSGRKVNSKSSWVSSGNYSPKLIGKNYILAQEQSTYATTRLKDNSSSLFRGQVSKVSSDSSENRITPWEQSLNKINIISGNLGARNNKNCQSSQSVKFCTQRICMLVRRLANGTPVHNSRAELSASLLCSCCGALLDDRIMWLVPMQHMPKIYKASVHPVSPTTGTSRLRDAQGSRRFHFSDASCRRFEISSSDKCGIANSVRKQSLDFKQDVIYNRKGYEMVPERRPVHRKTPRRVVMGACISSASEQLEKEPAPPLEGSLKSGKDLSGRLNHNTPQRELPCDTVNQKNEHVSVTKPLDVKTVVQYVKPLSALEQLESEHVSRTDEFSQNNSELAIDQKVQKNEYSLVPEMINGASSFSFDHPENKNANQMYDQVPKQKKVYTSAQEDKCSSAPQNLECEQAVRMNDIVTRLETPASDLTVQADNALSLQEKLDSCSAIQMNAPSFLSGNQNNQPTPGMSYLSLTSLHFIDKRLESDEADQKKQLSFTFMEPDSKPSVLMNEPSHAQIEVASNASIWTNNSSYVSDELKSNLDTEKDERFSTPVKGKSKMAEGISNHFCEVVQLTSNLVEQPNDRIAEKLPCDSAVETDKFSTTLEQLDFEMATHTKNQLSSQKEPDSDLKFQTENQSPVQEQFKIDRLQHGEESSFPQVHSKNKPFIQRMDDPSSAKVIANESAFLRIDNLTDEPDTKSDNPPSAAEGFEKDMAVWRDGPTSVPETFKSESTFQRKDMSLVHEHIGSDLATQNNELLSPTKQLKNKTDRPDIQSAWQNSTSPPPLVQLECKQAVQRLDFLPTSKGSSSIPAKWQHCTKYTTTEPISGVDDCISLPQIPPESAVQALFEHGYDHHTVREAYGKIQQRSGSPCAADLMGAILDTEHKEKETRTDIQKLEPNNGAETGTLPTKRGKEKACVNSSKAKKGPAFSPDSQESKICCTTLTFVVFLPCAHMMKTCTRCDSVLRKCPKCKMTITRIIEPKF